ncbi:MAG: DUF6624 domain-containing protein [Pseudomonadota bacterium]
MDAALREELLDLQRRDGATRARLLAAGRLYGDYAEEMQQVHRRNAERLAAIVAAQGWPGRTLVGTDGARAAWQIAQHAICTPALQRGFHVQLTAAVAAGEATPLQLAYLTDRIRFNEQRPQCYGLVLDWNAAGELGCVLEAPAGVDARRAAVGLPPFAEDLARQRAAVAAEGGTCPAEYAAYRARATAWAHRTGWL